MATLTWRGNSGSWTTPLSWQTFVEPGAGDVAVFGSADGSIATLNAPASIGGVDLVAGTQATVLLDNTLSLGGMFSLAGGTLDLAAGGAIEGGTVDLAGGTIVAAGGVADGVVWLAPLGGGLTITAATAAATEAAIGSLQVAGALTLEGGTYDSLAFASSSFATASNEVDAASGNTVTFGAATVVDATADDPTHAAGVQPVATSLTLGGLGSFENDGSIVSDLSLQALTISSAGFLNAGTIALDDSVVPDVQQTFYALNGGRYPVPVTLTFDQTLPPALLLTTPSFSNTGTIIGQAATVTVQAGTISLSNGAALGIGVLEPSSALTVAFGTGGNLLSLPVGSSGANAVGLTLANLQPGDLIDFLGISSSEPIGDPFGTGGAGIQDGTLDVQGASGEQASVALAGAGQGLTFVVTSDASGGTLVTVSCFRHGTRIATPGGEVAVQRLRIGDPVITAHGEAAPIKWLGRRRYSAKMVAAQPQLRPVRIGRGALGHGLPRRALFLSPLHGLLLQAPDGSEVVVPAAALVNGRSITRGPIAAVCYVHIELHTPDAVLAEGAAAETFVDCDSRGLFDNCAEYAAQYPEDDGSAKWVYCAPRVEDGWLLEAIRAGLPDSPAPQAESGRLRGHVDRCADGVIEGWVMDQDAPETPVELEVLVGGRQVTCIVANRYRIDLDHAGLGRGGCAFVAELPQLDAAAMASVRLRSLRSGTWL